MPSPVESPGDASALSRETLVPLAALTAIAVVVHSAEQILPAPLPGVRLGLANILTLCALDLFGLRAALILTVNRVLLGSLLSGTFLGPAFLLSGAGGIASVLAMGLLYQIRTPGGRRPFSLVGLSLTGAFVHNLAQLSVVHLLFVRHPEVFFLLPLMAGAAAATGLFNGLVALPLAAHLRLLLAKPVGS
ncbi:MAG: Gx transporter family protein [Nitrospirae bacterium]|nr:Gx transporter family protein [Nitrospirota bacterium]